MFERLTSRGVKTGELVVGVSASTGRSSFYQIEQLSLEELLMELSTYGKPRVGMYSDDSTWHCNVEMNTNTVGAEFKCASDFKQPTPTVAAKQCLERVLKAVEQYRK
jgi:carbamoylphosphate synthase large subunit